MKIRGVGVADADEFRLDLLVMGAKDFGDGVDLAQTPDVRVVELVAAQFLAVRFRRVDLALAEGAQLQQFQELLDRPISVPDSRMKALLSVPGVLD